MGARNLIEKLARAEAALRGRIFLAPLMGDGRARLRLQGLVYELVVQVPRPGWWRCKMLDAGRARAVEEAEPWQRGEYLALWPALRLVLLEPLGPAAWLALPFNPSDAQQRFGLAGPLALGLVEGGQPFERVMARVEGGALWYDDVDRRGDPALAGELREALLAARAEPGLAGLAPGEQAAYRLLAGKQAAATAVDQTTRERYRLRHALELGGARLIGYEPVENGARVIWERDGQRSVTLVDANLNVVSAGICLSGEDERFDLASIVGVVRDAPDFAHYNEE